MPQTKVPGELRIDENKIVDYLLNPAKSRGKAAFFLRLGFRPEEWQVLAEALREQAKANPVANAVVSPYGMRYSVDGLLQTPNPREALPAIRTVWIQEDGGCARLITAHPV
jgi:hypothetical protein